MDDSCLTADPRTPPAPQGRRGTTLRAAVVAVAAWVLMPWAMAADEPPSARDIRDGIDAAARLFEAGKSQEALAPLAEAARHESDALAGGRSPRVAECAKQRAQAKGDRDRDRQQDRRSEAPDQSAVRAVAMHDGNRPRWVSCGCAAARRRILAVCDAGRQETSIAATTTSTLHWEQRP